MTEIRPAVPANYLPLRVGENPARKDDGEPAFAVFSRDGWPVALFWRRDHAAWFAEAVASAATSPDPE